MNKILGNYARSSNYKKLIQKTGKIWKTKTEIGAIRFPPIGNNRGRTSPKNEKANTVELKQDTLEQHNEIKTIEEKPIENQKTEIKTQENKPKVEIKKEVKKIEVKKVEVKKIEENDYPEEYEEPIGEES